MAGPSNIPRWSSWPARARTTRAQAFGPLEDPPIAEVAGDELELAQLRAALVQARRETEDLRLQLIRESQQRDELLSIVSHELRTPITVIDGFNKLMLSETPGVLTEDQRHYLEQSRRSCLRLNLFVGNLLEQERLRIGETALHREPNCLDALFDEVAAFLSPLVTESGQVLEFSIASDASRACFDPSSVEQVLVNLIGNGLKYGPSGGALRVHCQRLGGNPAMVEISVLDEGTGVPEEERERIFEPYVRRPEHAGSGGLGLGLAICRRIVEAHGGHIGVGEGPGGGCRFAFTLPAVKEEP